MSREFRVLSKLHSVYSPAPEVLLYCNDDSVIGAPFYVMARVVGHIVRDDLPAGYADTEEQRPQGQHRPV